MAGPWWKDRYNLDAPLHPLQMSLTSYLNRYVLRYRIEFP
jgi:hypothetical protein